MKKKKGGTAQYAKGIATASILIACIIVVAAIVRSYHIDYPAIGYHNVKENFYIGMAKFMRMDGDYIHRKAFDSGYLETPYFEEYPQIPLISWWAAMVWPMTGLTLWPVRMLIVLSSCLCIYLIFKIALRIHKDTFWAVLSAVFFALFPLSIFFGRNIQPEALALASMLGGTIYFLKWRDSFEAKTLAAVAFFFGIGGLLKLTFLILAFPLIFLAPYGRLFDRKNLHATAKNLFAATLGLIPFFAWTAAAPFINKVSGLTEQTQHRVRIFEILSESYWTNAWAPIHSYIDENFTFFGAFLVLAGCSIFGFFVPSKIARFSTFAGLFFALGMVVSFPSPVAAGPSGMELTGWPLGFALFTVLFLSTIIATTICAAICKNTLGAYMGGSILAVVPYSAILSDFTYQHNYYQFPFLPIASLAAAMPLVAIKAFLENPLGRRWAVVPALVLLILFIPGAVKNTSRMFDTQFFGCDAGGEFLRKSMPKGERFFLFGSHQSVGFGNYAERLCIFSGTFPSLKISLADFLKFEKKFGIDWVCVDVLNSGLQIMNLDPELFKYIEKNFGIYAIGILKAGDQTRLATLILRKPGSFELARIGDSSLLKNNPSVQHTYELTSGKLKYEIFSELK